MLTIVQPPKSVRVYVTPVLSLMGETFYKNNDVLVTPVLAAMGDRL
jgi:hypothetical protein